LSDQSNKGRLFEKMWPHMLVTFNEGSAKRIFQTKQIVDTEPLFHWCLENYAMLNMMAIHISQPLNSSMARVLLVMDQQ